MSLTRTKTDVKSAARLVEANGRVVGMTVRLSPFEVEAVLLGEDRDYALGVVKDRKRASKLVLDAHAESSYLSKLERKGKEVSET